MCIPLTLMFAKAQIKAVLKGNSKCVAFIHTKYFSLF